MEVAARRWFDARTFQAARFGAADLLAAKAETGDTVSVVIPARNEAATIAGVVSQIRDSLVTSGLVDELMVIDSDSTDDTADRARAAGATVFAASAIDTGTSAATGKGEALWKSLFVTSGEVLVFIDADLTAWGPHFVTGLLGPLLIEPETLLVKGFYDRLADDLPSPGRLDRPDRPDRPGRPQGGRVTELVARPLLNLYWPELAAVIQPLAGEWAIRRSVMQALQVPVGYGVEFAALTDTWHRYGLAAIAQVDLGRRGHRHQNVHDLGVMAAEILATAMRRLPGAPAREAQPGRLQQYDRAATGSWLSRPVPTMERPPARDHPAYHARRGAVPGTERVAGPCRGPNPTPGRSEATCSS